MTALLLVAAPCSGAAQTTTPPQTTVRADSTHRSRPFFVMLRSAAVPGWGQVYNHKWLKAAAVVGGEGYIAYRALKELQKENEAVDRQTALLGAGADPLGPEYLLAEEDRLEHRNRKINWIWWGLAAHLLSMIDAYVDAHLASFDADFGAPESARDIGEKPRLTLALRTRF